MNVRKFKGSRALALLLALSMVMMYSVTLTSFAATTPVPCKNMGDSYLEYVEPTPDDVLLQPGEVLWHLTSSPVSDGASAFITDGNSTWHGYQPSTGAGVLHWNIITTDLTCPGWMIAYFDTGVLFHENGANQGEMKTELRVSHTYYGGDIEDPTEGTIIVKKDVIYEGDTNVNPSDSHPFNFTYVRSNLESNDSKISQPPLVSGSGVVSETSSPSITLPFGTYIFTETVENGYTGVVTSHSITIIERTTTQTIEFVNSKPMPTNPLYDLGITKVVDNESVRLGGEATFTITITNSSDSAITVEAIYADDDWPEGLSINGVVAEEGTSYDGSWRVGTLIPGQSKVLTMTAIATTIGPITNTISIGTDRPSGDTNTENDNASASIRVYDPTTVTIQKDVPNVTDSTELFDVTIYKLVQETTLEAIRVVQISEVVSYPFDVTDSGLYTFVETTKAGYTTSQASFEIEVEVGPDGDQTVTFVNTKDNTDTSTNNTTTSTRRTTPTPVVIVEPEIPLAEEPVVTPIILEEPVPLADVVPQTSDTGNILLLLGLMLGSGLGITALGRRKETE